MSNPSHTAARPREAIRPEIGIVRSRGTFRVVALAPVRSGEVVLSVHGELVNRPSRYSVQVGEAEHIELPSDRAALDPDQTFDLYPWRYLNHSCSPNLALRGREFVSIRDIAEWEEVVFDYRTTELELATPFVCQCGEPTCRGEPILGYRFLTAIQQQQLQPLLADYLAARLRSTRPGH